MPHATPFGLSHLIFLMSFVEQALISYMYMYGRKAPPRRKRRRKAAPPYKNAAPPQQKEMEKHSTTLKKRDIHPHRPCLHHHPEGGGVRSTSPSDGDDRLPTASDAQLVPRRKCSTSRNYQQRRFRKLHVFGNASRSSKKNIKVGPEAFSRMVFITKQHLLQLNLIFFNSSIEFDYHFCFFDLIPF